MTKTIKLLALAGSLRKDSYNFRLARIMAAAAKEAQAEVNLIHLADYPLPIFNQDDEEASGLPENAKKLKALFRESHGFLISAPEYNSSISGALKNVIDWVSRQEGAEEPPLIAFTGKTAALTSASIGALGGLRGLVHVRAILGNIGVYVLPGQVSIPKATAAFKEDGALHDHRKQEQVEDLARQLVDYTRMLN